MSQSHSKRTASHCHRVPQLSVLCSTNRVTVFLCVPVPQCCHLLVCLYSNPLCLCPSSLVTPAPVAALSAACSSVSGCDFSLARCSKAVLSLVSCCLVFSTVLSTIPGLCIASNKYSPPPPPPPFSEKSYSKEF